MTKGSRGCCRAPVECVQSGPEAAHGASMASGAYLAKLAAWYSAGYNGAVQVVQERNRLPVCCVACLHPAYASKDNGS